jgi:hypothetical protein
VLDRLFGDPDSLVRAEIPLAMRRAALPVEQLEPDLARRVVLDLNTLMGEILLEMGDATPPKARAHHRRPA